LLRLSFRMPRLFLPSFLPSSHPCLASLLPCVLCFPLSFPTPLLEPHGRRGIPARGGGDLRSGSEASQGRKQQRQGFRFAHGTNVGFECLTSSDLELYTLLWHLTSFVSSQIPDDNHEFDGHLAHRIANFNAFAGCVQPNQARLRFRKGFECERVIGSTVVLHNLRTQWRL
jgi:hypothetical protein